MSVEAKSSWEYHKSLPLGLLNRLNKSITRKRLQTGQEDNFASILADIFGVVYGPEIKPGSGPYAAVVLDVLASPKINESAKHKDKPPPKAELSETKLLLRILRPLEMNRPQFASWLKSQSLTLICHGLMETRTRRGSNFMASFCK